MAPAPVDSQQDVRITVHWLESSRAQRLLVLLEELNLKYDIKTYKRSKDGLAPQELKEIHPLGKSPVVVIEAPDKTPIVLAESGAIFEYIAERWGKHLIPAKVAAESRDETGGETEGFRRNRYFMHYSEGSLMSLLAIAVVMLNIKNAPVPFFIKPITRMITSKISEAFLEPNFQAHFDFIESQLKTSPDGGEYLCGRELTEADIMMIFPLEAAQPWAGLSRTNHPLIFAYLENLKQRDSYKRAEKKVIEIEGSFKPIF